MPVVPERLVPVEFLSKLSDSRWDFVRWNMPDVPVFILEHGQLPKQLPTIRVVPAVVQLLQVMLAELVHADRILLLRQSLSDAAALCVLAGQPRQLLLRPVQLHQVATTEGVRPDAEPGPTNAVRRDDLCFVLRCRHRRS